jgi:DNA-binding CsgD family transcriptional regulator
MKTKCSNCSTNAWKISKELSRNFNTKNIRNDLNLFDRICQNNLRPCHASFFVIDFYKRKIMFGALSPQLFLGYHTDLIEDSGLDFYKLVLSKDELKWWEQLNMAMQEVLQNFPISERCNLTFSYELIATDENKRNVILQHTLTPYKLDENGNMWLSLCRVKPAKRLSVLGKASLINSETGDHFDYFDGHFLPSIVTTLTELDIEILGYVAGGLQRKEISEKMKILESTMKKKIQDIFKKLNVTTSAAAVYKAAQMNII